MPQEMTDRRIINRWSGGLGWIAHPDELMERASQAIAGDSGAWLIDPLDMDGSGDLLDEFDGVAGVVVTLDRHTRDAATLANRYDVSVHAPERVLGSIDVDAPTAPLDAFTQDTGFEAVAVVSVPGWREFALYDAAGGTVIVADAIGTASYFLGPGERLGVHPTLRLTPPRNALGHMTADRVLVGHGPGLMTDATLALHDALSGARRRAPWVYARGVGTLPTILFGGLKK